MKEVTQSLTGPFKNALPLSFTHAHTWKRMRALQRRQSREEAGMAANNELSDRQRIHTHCVCSSCVHHVLPGQSHTAGWGDGCALLYHAFTWFYFFVLPSEKKSWACLTKSHLLVRLNDVLLIKQVCPCVFLTGHTRAHTLSQMSLCSQTLSSQLE